MDYWKVTLGDTHERFDIPATYYGDMAMTDLVKKHGASELRYVKGAEEPLYGNAPAKVAV